MSKKNTRLQLAATLLLALSSSGCGLLQPLLQEDAPSLGLSLPARWFATTPEAAGLPAQSAEELAAWWQVFGDATLSALIDEALQANLDLQLAQSRLRQARASRDQAVANRFPQLTGSAGQTRSQPANTQGVATQTRTTYDAGFDASWEVDLFGARAFASDAAAAELQASVASLGSTRVSLVAEVARNYIDLRAYQRRLAIARDNLNSQSETAQIVEWRNQAGLAAASDVEQARTSREQTRAGIPDLEVGRAGTEFRLAVLLGQTPGALAERLAETRALPELPASVATGIPAEVLRRRPDLVAAERTLVAETARLGQRRAERFPSLNLAASFGWQAYAASALGSGDSRYRSSSGTLAATLFDAGRLRAAVDLQDAVQEQALLTYRNGVLGALEEVENALTAYAAGRERVTARRAAAEAARNAAELSRQLYQSGLADFQKVLETERTRLSAEDSLATAEATLRTALIQLYKTLGGGWSPTVNPEKG